ncbi:hypothetical protein Metho_1427 [Methanomethylovorans hollandica DSM 15978]|uniref:Uncharacterized protein n=1 Tax=Methanomethylovorans hollandica (strain DSM 15978 / NBRC 107637 / DMS1) TaxID=867904 RepID=L0KY67_METHD|nr:hypothetical protein [Methanomethylovorans hollandica]AGB49635.1 hypothetical protein Metho_1427 [Methanomethylovorans hollandica DSM 15978]
MLDLLLKVLDFAIPILIVIAIGLFGTGLLIELGLMQKLSVIAGPLFRHTNLPESCASAFVVALGSTVAANSMVVQVRNSGCINDTEAMLCALLNSTPAYIREILTYQIPIVLPALGYFVGGFYVGVFILTAIVKISIVVILSKLLLEKNNCKMTDTTTRKKVSLKDAIKRTFMKEKRLFTRIALVYLAMTTIVFYLRENGILEVFSLLPLANIFHIPSESIVPLTTYIASPIMGISLLGPMLSDNGISPVQAMIVLMLGSMFMLPMFGIRSLLPRYISLFGAKVGTKIVGISVGISVFVRLTILILLLQVAG